MSTNTTVITEKPKTSRRYVIALSKKRLEENAKLNSRAPKPGRHLMACATGQEAAALSLGVEKTVRKNEKTIEIEGELESGDRFTGTYNPMTETASLDIVKR